MCLCLPLFYLIRHLNLVESYLETFPLVCKKHVGSRPKLSCSGPHIDATFV